MKHDSDKDINENVVNKGHIDDEWHIGSECGVCVCWCVVKTKPNHDLVGNPVKFKETEKW